MGERKKLNTARKSSSRVIAVGFKSPGHEHQLSWVIFLSFIGATLVMGVGVFRYDAWAYWETAQSAFGPRPGVEEYYWGLRGVLGNFMFLPAAGLARLFGAGFDGFFVLLQNALLFAAFASFLLPRCVAIWRPVTAQIRLLGALLAWIVLVGFAPYPLVDAYPAIAIFGILVLLQSTRSSVLVLAGVFAGIAVNIRPSYLVVVGGFLVVAFIWRQWRGIWFAFGILVGLVPQLIMNVIRIGEWSLWPPLSASLVSLQAEYGSYVVRYDTLFGADAPQQFYCSPGMAQALTLPLPQTAGELASAFLSHIPTSVVFALQKVGASLHWPLSTPYTTSNVGVDGLFALAITLITVCGISSLLFTVFRKRLGERWRHSSWLAAALAGVVVIGGTLTIVASASESRFALPLVLIGVLGCASLGNAKLRNFWQKHRYWIASTALIAVVVWFFGVSGLQHPAPAGPVDQGICASL
ncbi:hypothetical protein [Cryobacterium sp. M15]|uniref:hypothetical protein n=1 Tax=Cryobacterium sp. M15 TaxID=2048291 RepID=UPI0011B03E41|nr:hypothetical protein [Cryobacterium sp. M15]